MVTLHVYTWSCVCARENPGSLGLIASHGRQSESILPQASSPINWLLIDFKGLRSKHNGRKFYHCGRSFFFLLVGAPSRKNHSSVGIPAARENSISNTNKSLCEDVCFFCSLGWRPKFRKRKNFPRQGASTTSECTKTHDARHRESDIAPDGKFGWNMLKVRESLRKLSELQAESTSQRGQTAPHHEPPGAKSVETN